MAPKIGGYSVVERYLRNGGMDGHAQEAYAKAVYGHREDVIELLEEFLPSTQHTQSQLATANMLMAGIPLVAILAGEGMAICIASPACRTGLAILEVSDCAINPDPTCVTPGPSLPKPDKNTGSAGQNNGTQTANNNGGNGNVGEAPNSATIGGKTCVYSCEVGGVTRYVGITDDIVKRGQAHMREKGIAIRRIPGLSNLSRADALAVEQTLINYHGLGKNGGTLINKINSISAVKNPTKYEQSLVRGAELLKQYKYPGF